MEIMSFQSKFPCFVQYGAHKAISGFKARLLYGQTLTDQQVTRLVDGLVQCVRCLHTLLSFSSPHGCPPRLCRHPCALLL